MEVNSVKVKTLKNIDDEFKSDENIINIEQDVKIEIADEKGNVKTEDFEGENNSEPKIIEEKRKNEKSQNLENKIEFAAFEESDFKQEVQKIQKSILDDSNIEVLTICKN
jgi:hypothetical protein